MKKIIGILVLIAVGAVVLQILEIIGEIILLIVGSICVVAAIIAWLVYRARS